MALVVVVALIVVDALLGVITALKNGDFSLKEIPRFLATNVLPYVGGILIIGLVVVLIPEPFNEIFMVVFYASAVAVSLRYVLEIYGKVSRLFGVDITK